MLRCVADDREQYKTDKGTADVCFLNNGIDAVNEIFRAECNQDGDNDQGDSSPATEDMFFAMFSLFVAILHRLGLGFLIEEVGMGLQLEEEI